MRKIITFLMLFAVFTLGVSAYTIEGNSVFMEDAQASLRVTPHTAQFPSLEGYQQEFDICNKTGVDTTLYGAYLFDFNLLQGKAEYLASENYAWVGQEVYCGFEFDYNSNVNSAPNIHQGDCYYMDGIDKVVDFSISFKSVERKLIQYDANELVKNWTNVTSSFQEREMLIPEAKTAYIYTEGKNILANTCETWRITYKPKEKDGKWDLWLWADNESWRCILNDTCLKTLKLDPHWTGVGSAVDPFIVTDCNQLQTIQSYTRPIGSPLVAYFELGNDIDCSGFGNFDPIGSYSALAFHGHLDGNNYSISNVTINTATANEGGLISYMYNGSSMKNVALIDFNSWDSVEGSATVTRNCFNADINNVYVQGAVVGGLGNTVGGFVGYATGTVALGGCQITNSYVVDTTVSVAPSTVSVGGFAGSLNHSADINNSYSNAAVTGVHADVGAFLGRNWGDGATCSDAFYDVNTAIHIDNDPTCGTSLETIEMFKEASFTNWDFTSIWTIEEDVSYPTLQSFPLPNDAPYMTSVDLNITIAKQNDHIKATASDVNDVDNDAVTLLCGTAANPTIDTNNFCTAFAVASPYTDVSCTGLGAAGDGVQTVYCRIYDSTAYSIDQNTDTYTADNTAPTTAYIHPLIDQESTSGLVTFLVKIDEPGTCYYGLYLNDALDYNSSIDANASFVCVISYFGFVEYGDEAYMITTRNDDTIGNQGVDVQTTGTVTYILPAGVVDAENIQDADMLQIGMFTIYQVFIGFAAFFIPFFGLLILFVLLVVYFKAKK